MRKKSMVTMVLAAGLTLAASFCSFAGEWKADDVGKFYQNTDGSYLSNGWYWVDGKSYYFNEQGYCLVSATTPDGYTVDESGAWTENGAVKTRATEEAMATIKVIIPNGYDYVRDDESGSIELNAANDSSNAGILVMDIVEEDLAFIKTYLGEEGLKAISDEVVHGATGEFSDVLTLAATSSKTYGATGTWNYYLYNGTDESGNAVSLEFYTSFTDRDIRMVAIMIGAGREFTSNDEFMENCIR